MAPGRALLAARPVCARATRSRPARGGTQPAASVATTAAAATRVTRGSGGALPWPVAAGTAASAGAQRLEGEAALVLALVLVLVSAATCPARSPYQRSRPDDHATNVNASFSRQNTLGMAGAVIVSPTVEEVTLSPRSKAEVLVAEHMGPLLDRVDTGQRMRLDDVVATLVRVFEVTKLKPISWRWRRLGQQPGAQRPEGVGLWGRPWLTQTGWGGAQRVRCWSCTIRSCMWRASCRPTVTRTRHKARASGGSARRARRRCVSQDGVRANPPTNAEREGWAGAQRVDVALSLADPRFGPPVTRRLYALHGAAGADHVVLAHYATTRPGSSVRVGCGSPSLAC
jgi:hypothetical protein